MISLIESVCKKKSMWRLQKENFGMFVSNFCTDRKQNRDKETDFSVQIWRNILLHNLKNSEDVNQFLSVLFLQCNCYRWYNLFLRSSFSNMLLVKLLERLHILASNFWSNSFKFMSGSKTKQVQRIRMFLYSIWQKILLHNIKISEGFIQFLSIRFLQCIRQKWRKSY